MEDMVIPATSSNVCGATVLPVDNVQDRVIKGKRRLLQEVKHKRNERKIKRCRGDEYVNKSGQIVQRKQRKQQNCCNNAFCKLGEISDEQKNEIFRSFYTIADYNHQNAFLFGLIKQTSVKRITPKDRKNPSSSRRSKSFAYTVKTQDGSTVRVCQKAFLLAYGITQRRMRTIRGEHHVVKPSVIQPALLCAPSIDLRGRHRNRPNKTPHEQINSIRNHIQRFPRYRSHYSRRDNPNKSYIQSVSSVTEMYKLYKKDCHDKRINPATCHMYRQIFNTEFNISFKLPLTDTCKVCDQYSNDPENPSFQFHQSNAQLTYDSYKKDKQESQNPQSDTLVITVDLQQALPTPMIPTETVFYLRQLWTYNCGIHVCNDNSAVMCVWPEYTASRGADEIASCLLKVLKKIIGERKKIIVWSDSCGGQNKNFTIMVLWQYLCQSLPIIESITHKFFVPGHSFMASDSDFGLIEKKKRKTQYVYVHQMWIDLIKASRLIKPFDVEEMTSVDVFSFTPLINLFCNRKKTTDGQVFHFQKCISFSVSKDHPGFIRCRYNHNTEDEFQVSLNKRGRFPNVDNIILPPKYPTGRVIKQAKVNDLQKMMPFIPPIYHPYYQAIIGDGTADLSTIEDLESDGNLQEFDDYVNHD